VGGRGDGAALCATAAGGAQLGVLVLAQALHAITFAAHHAACIALVTALPGRLRGRGQALYTTLGYGGGLGGVSSRRRRVFSWWRRLRKGHGQG
jgi:predicted NBD/HSP70 family sugar kinase